MSSAIEFHDDEDHLVNGVLRLLDLDRDELERWRELSEAHEGTLLERLAVGWRELRPPPVPPEGSAAAGVDTGPAGEHGTLWHPALAESPDFGFARSDDGKLAWLVRFDGEQWTRESEPPEYEEGYFEGGREEGGYGGYREEAGWRLEKSARQVREMREATGLASGRVLDIGSGYGYFRVALGEAGFEHAGLEVSAHGRAVAAEAFGQETYGGLLSEHVDDWTGGFDALTAFDLIEHVADPVGFLREAGRVLRRGGFLGLKTPNVDAPEAQVFGPHYHSLKREHLVLFTPGSLAATAATAGFEPVEVSTVSHLLRGFAGDEQCRAWEREGRGADVVAWFRRSS